MNNELQQALNALKAAAEEIIKLHQPQPDMPYPFEAGKVYKMVGIKNNLDGTKHRWFFKFKSFNEKQKLINHFWSISCFDIFNTDSDLGISNVTFSPADPSEYSQYLPDGYLDKIPTPVEYITEVSKLPEMSYENQQKAVAYANILCVVAYCNSQFEADGNGWVFNGDFKRVSYPLFRIYKRYGYLFTSKKAIELAKNTPDFIKQFEVWMG